LDGSHVVRDAAYVDEGALMAQLGLNPAPARAALTPAGMPPVVVVAKNDDTENRNIAAARASIDVWNAKDVKGVEATMADTYRMIEMGQAKDLDKTAALASVKEFWGGFPDIRITLADVWAAGDYVVMTGSISGTNTGDLPSWQVKKTGKPVTLKFVEIVKFENGKMTDDYVFYNGAAMAGQLGLLK
jgi:predicted ester cyclase